MKKDLIIVGAGGLASDFVWTLEESSQWNILGYVTKDVHEPDSMGIPILGDDTVIPRHLNAHFIVAVGPPRIRRRIVENLTHLGVDKFATLVHPRACISSLATIGPGSAVLCGAMIGANVSVGAHSVINLGATLGHDVALGEFCTVAPQAALSGRVRLGSLVELGTNSSIVPSVSVADGCVVAAGATLFRSAEHPNMLWLGNPARPVKPID